MMVNVARCESTFREFGKDGEVLRGKVNPLDRGIFQINETYHLRDSAKMGIDIYTIEGNIAYARYLYDTQGTKPWNWSRGCWSPL